MARRMLICSALAVALGVHLDTMTTVADRRHEVVLLAAAKPKHKEQNGLKKAVKKQAIGQVLGKEGLQAPPPMP